MAKFMEYLLLHNTIRCLDEGMVPNLYILFVTRDEVELLNIAVIILIDSKLGFNTPEILGLNTS